MLTRRKLIAAAAVLLGGSATGCSAGSTRSPEGQPRYTYGDHPSQYAELTLPAGPGPAPVVVIVHGGFWMTSYGAELGRPLAADLVTRGWATLNVEYRRVGRSKTKGGGGWPTTMTDVAAAVDALATQGQELAGGRLDLTRVVALGHSAGGQLAGWLAARPTLPANAPGANPVVRLTGFVAQAGVMDLVGAADEAVGGLAVPGLMGGSPGRLPEAYALASPIARVPLGVPSVCVHGTSDGNVPLSQSERFVAASTRAGDRSELRTFDGDHFAPITVGTPAWTMCTDALETFLRV
ncbi:MAG TPA: prolyl oligopeptidase family serine peptidase [Propionibacteriaceae bacterium]